MTFIRRYGEEIIRKMTKVSHGTDCEVYGRAHTKVKSSISRNSNRG